MNTKCRIFAWKLLVDWYGVALRVERAMGLRWGWTAMRVWHKYAVWYPLVWSFRVWPIDTRVNEMDRRRKLCAASNAAGRRWPIRAGARDDPGRRGHGGRAP